MFSWRKGIRGINPPRGSIFDTIKTHRPQTSGAFSNSAVNSPPSSRGDRERTHHAHNKNEWARRIKPSNGRLRKEAPPRKQQAYRAPLLSVIPHDKVARLDRCDEDAPRRYPWPSSGRDPENIAGDDANAPSILFQIYAPLYGTHSERVLSYLLKVSVAVLFKKQSQYILIIICLSCEMFIILILVWYSQKCHIKKI